MSKCLVCVMKEALDRLVLLRQCGQSHISVPSFLCHFTRSPRTVLLEFFPSAALMAF